MSDCGIENSTGGSGMLLIWDVDGSPPTGDWTNVLWRQYAGVRNSSTVSIPEFVDLHADEIRARYLAWIHDLGETRIDGVRVTDHLQIRPGLSYWWMTSVAQKFNVSGVSGIDNAIKALGLEKLVDERGSKFIVLVTGKKSLETIVQHFCRSKGIGYEFRQAGVDRKSRTRRRLFQLLPQSWRAFAYLAWYVLNAFPLLFLRRKPACMPAGQVTFIDVLTHLDKRTVSTGSFFSNYWTDLVGKLSEWKINSNWLHLFFRQSATPSFAKARHQINRLNETSGGSQFHALLERPLSLSMMASVLQDYLKVRRSWNILQGICATRPAGSSLDLWPMHAGEWSDSLCGKEAMANCLRLSLFEAAANLLPQQKIGVYIAENQPWEMALIYAWKTAGHGVLIGTPHTVVRFWDLRYHYDARSYIGEKVGRLPSPDVLAVNGPVARESVLGGGYPADRVREVEALRFLHLAIPRPGGVPGRLVAAELRVLVCGDFLAETNCKVLAWLEIAARSLPGDTVYVIKPHPAYPLSSADHPALKLEMSEAPLADLLLECDVVFTSNITSAAVDAYCSGVTVIQMLDGDTLNVSPLRGLKGVIYVTSPDELTAALLEAKKCECAVPVTYFYLDEKLPRWRVLLNLSP